MVVVMHKEAETLHVVAQATRGTVDTTTGATP